MRQNVLDFLDFRLSLSLHLSLPFIRFILALFESTCKMKAVQPAKRHSLGRVGLADIVVLALPACVLMYLSLNAWMSVKTTGKVERGAQIYIEI